MANIWKIAHQPLLLRQKRMLKLLSPPSCFTSNSSSTERNSLLGSNSVPGGLPHTGQRGVEILLVLCFLCMLANHPVVWTGDLDLLPVGALSLWTSKWLPFYLMVPFTSHCLLKITHSWVTFQYPRGSLALYSRQISSTSTLMELSVISSRMASGSLPLTQSIVRRFLIHRDTVKANKLHYNEFLTAAWVPDLTWPWCNSTQTSSRSRCLQPKQPMPKKGFITQGNCPYPWQV